MKVLACDQSLNGTALCLIEDCKDVLLMETIRHDDSVKGFARTSRILKRIREVLTEHVPLVFVLEDYSGGANINTMIPLVELGGCIKLLVLEELGYQLGREAILTGHMVMMIQAVSSMKKFMLGQGNVSKDSSYLLKVYQKLNVAFEDDNQADAYMHAQMAALVYKVTRGEVPIGNLTNTQQEALISHGVKRQKGLSITKAMKLSDEAKRQLAGF